jgi:hypothetical protein
MISPELLEDEMNWYCKSIIMYVEWDGEATEINLMGMNQITC